MAAGQPVSDICFCHNGKLAYLYSSGIASCVRGATKPLHTGSDPQILSLIVLGQIGCSALLLEPRLFCVIVLLMYLFALLFVAWLSLVPFVHWLVLVLLLMNYLSAESQRKSNSHYLNRNGDLFIPVTERFRII